MKYGLARRLVLKMFDPAKFCPNSYVFLMLNTDVQSVKSEVIGRSVVRTPAEQAIDNYRMINNEGYEEKQDQMMHDDSVLSRSRKSA